MTASPSAAPGPRPARGTLEAWLAAELEFRALSDPLLASPEDADVDLDDDAAMDLLSARGRADRRLADFLGPWLD